jgi:hypothetical protein
MKKEFKILSPTAILGYGFPEESFANGMARQPDLIAVDAGSVDPGPYYLGSGKSFTDRTGVKRDLRLILAAGVRARIPVLIGSAGGSGADTHLAWCREIIEELAREEKLSFKLAVIHAEIDKRTVLQAVKAGQTSPLGGLPELDAATVNRAPRIVAQMGIEPFVAALAGGAEVVLAGRAYDPAVFAALPTMLGYDPALAMHLGKILECAAIAAEPGSGADCVLGILKEKSFVLRALSDKRRFTRDSVAAHSLYEKSDPYALPGPGGTLDLRAVEFKEIGDGEVEVSGSRFLPARPYTIKLEGAQPVAWRTISIAGSRDPVMIEKIDSTLAAVRRQTEAILRRDRIAGEVIFHIYGLNAVMGPREFVKGTTGHEIGILLEAVAPSRQEADTICSITRSTLLHYGYEGRISTAGNLAFPFSPSDISCGEVYEFSIYHLMEIDDPAMFPIEFCEVKN